MALIKVGSIGDFSVAQKKSSIKANVNFNAIKNFNELNEISRVALPNSFDLITSNDQRGLGIKSLKLERGFEGFLGNLFKSTNNIYFIAWAFDMSGEPVSLYPGKDTNVNDVLIPMKVGNLREFIGSGINLFPKRIVRGGVAIRIQIWESDENIRKFGKVVEDTAKTVEDSKLNNLLSLIALGTGVSGVTITMVKDAAIELSKLIGAILQANGDDYVDFFEGYYAAPISYGNRGTRHIKVIHLLLHCKNIDVIINITIGNAILRKPIDKTMLEKGVNLLNEIFNTPEFGIELSKQSFFISNRPGFSANGSEILGNEVYNDLINKGVITINIEIKKGGFLSKGFFKKILFGTLGETDPSGITIVTYNSWLKQLDSDELFVLYTTHLGHEIFHTKYFGYVHNPEYGGAKFVSDKDVTYKIDEILESFIRRYK